MTKPLKWIGMAISVLFISTIFWFSIGVSSDHLSEVFPPNEHKFTENSLTTVEITKPMEGHLYMFDRDIAPIGITLVVGGITIEVETSEDIDGIDIYIDDVLKFSDYTYPYSRVWNEKVMGRHVIKAVAHGGNESDEVSVLIFNFPKSRPDATINEIMSDPTGDDAGNEWIELYNAGKSIRIKGWTISNSVGSDIATLPNWVFPNGTYLAVYFGNGINDDDFSDGNATFYVGSNQELFDNDMDECALYTGNPGSKTIIDFVAYCYEGNYTPGVAHDYATKTGIWDEGEYFHIVKEAFSIGSKLPGLIEGKSIGRDANSTDTNVPLDWWLNGGEDAFESSPGRCNLDVFGIVEKKMPVQLSNSVKEKNWTIMFYMAVDHNPLSKEDLNMGGQKKLDSLEPDAFEQLNKLEKVGTDDNINLVFQIDGKTRIEESYRDEDRWETRNTGKTFRGFLLKDNSTEYLDFPSVGARISANSLIYAYMPTGESACIGEKNTGEPDPLAEFINWAIENAPAKHYAIILSGHGWGWKGCMMDNTSHNDWLYMDELNQAFGSVNYKFFDIIGFDMCYMAMIEVGEQIEHYGKIMVASEDIEPAGGWDYKGIFEDLSKNPQWDGEALAKKIIQSYDDHYKFSKSPNPNDDFYTLSAVRLNYDYYNRLMNSMAILSQNLRKGMEDWGDNENAPYTTHGNPGDNCQMDVSNVRHCNRVTYLATMKDDNFVDLYVLIDEINKSNGIYKEYKEGSKDVLSYIKKVLIGQVYNKFMERHGISIYFPRNRITEGRGFSEGKPYNDPEPSRIKSPNDPLAIYAIDITTEHGKVPYEGRSPHPFPETPRLIFRSIGWHFFLHRYYKPCADAGPDQSFELEADENDVEVTLDGSGSSTTDDDTSYLKYYWDLDALVDVPNGKQYLNTTPKDDWDADGKDESNDDNQSYGKIVNVRLSPGTYNVTLTVWDDRHTHKNTEYEPGLQYQTDQGTCIIVVTKKPPKDTTPPTTTITDPPDQSKLDNPDITINGIATDNVGVVELGYHHGWEGGEEDYSWNIDKLTSFEFTFTLEIHPGWNEITVWAKDAAGNEGSDTVTVYYYPKEDTTPPVTTEEVGQPSWENGYVVTPGTLIWLNATDDTSGVDYIYYEVWWDSDSDGIIETKMGEKTAYTSNVELCFADYEIYAEAAELRFYAVDNAGNIEEMKVKQHLVQE